MASKLGLASYVVATVAVTTAAVYNAATTRKEFYPAAIYMTTNKINILVLSNLCFMLIVLLGNAIKTMFLGRLSRDEIEDLVQNSKFTITETCLALTIFREELNFKTLALFTTLLFVKSFHWLATLRVENVARADDLPMRAHVRLASLLGFLLLVDVVSVLAIWVAIMGNATLTPSVLFLFAFEYMILCVMVCSLSLKFVLLLIDQRLEGRWVNRSAWMFYLELSSDLIRLFLYLLFFTLIMHFYGLPIHLMRELYVTFATLKDRIRKFIDYRRLTHNMNERFPDASPEEIRAADPTCIICREDMQTAKKLPCTHLFHFHCLRSWLERSRSCPTCRADIPILPTRPLPPLPPHLAAVVRQAQAARAAAAAAAAAGGAGGAAAGAAGGAGGAAGTTTTTAPATDSGGAAGAATASGGSAATSEFVRAASHYGHGSAAPAATATASPSASASATAAPAPVTVVPATVLVQPQSQALVAQPVPGTAATAAVPPMALPWPPALPPGFAPFGAAVPGAPGAGAVPPPPFMFPPPPGAPMGFGFPPPHPAAFFGAGAGGMGMGARAGFPMFPPTGYNTASLFGALHAPPISSPPPVEAIAALLGSAFAGSGGTTAAANAATAAAAGLLQWQSSQQQVYQLWFENQTVLLQHHMEILQMQLAAIQSMYERQIAMQELISNGGNGGNGHNGSANLNANANGASNAHTATPQPHPPMSAALPAAASSAATSLLSVGGELKGEPATPPASAVATPAAAGQSHRPPINVLRALSISSSASGLASHRNSLTVPTSAAATPTPSLAGSPHHFFSPATGAGNNSGSGSGDHSAPGSARASITFPSSPRDTSTALAGPASGSNSAAVSRRSSLNTRVWHEPPTSTSSMHSTSTDAPPPSVATRISVTSFGVSPIPSPPVSPGPNSHDLQAVPPGPVSAPTSTAGTTATTTTAAGTPPSTNSGSSTSDAKVKSE